MSSVLNEALLFETGKSVLTTVLLNNYDDAVMENHTTGFDARMLIRSDSFEDIKQRIEKDMPPKDSLIIIDSGRAIKRTFDSLVSQLDQLVKLFDRDIVIFTKRYGIDLSQPELQLTKSVGWQIVEPSHRVFAGYWNGNEIEGRFIKTRDE